MPSIGASADLDRCRRQRRLLRLPPPGMDGIVLSSGDEEQAKSGIRPEPGHRRRGDPSVASNNPARSPRRRSAPHSLRRFRPFPHPGLHGENRTACSPNHRFCNAPQHETRHPATAVRPHHNETGPHGFRLIEDDLNRISREYDPVADDLIRPRCRNSLSNSPIGSVACSAGSLPKPGAARGFAGMDEDGFRFEPLRKLGPISQGGL